MPDEDLRALERAARDGTTADVERYLGARIRRSPDLVPKLVRRVIRLERVVVRGRINEEDYRAEVTDRDFLDFLERELPEQPRHAGRLSVEGEWPSEENERRGVPRGGPVNLTGGSQGAVPTGDGGIPIHPPEVNIQGVGGAFVGPLAIQALNEAIAGLQRRVLELEADRARARAT